MADGMDLTFKDVAELDTVTGVTGTDYMIIVRSGVIKKVTLTNAAIINA